jgi:K+-sensing histidine kinase KdpD
LVAEVEPRTTRDDAQGRGRWQAALDRVSCALSGPLDDVESALNAVAHALVPRCAEGCTLRVEYSSGGAHFAYSVEAGASDDVAQRLAKTLALPLRGRARDLGTLRLGSNRHAFEDASLLACLQEVAARVAGFLEHASELARAREESALRDALLSVVTHDAQSSLGAILLTAPMLEPSPCDSPTTTPAQVMQRAASALSTLLENVQTVRNGQLGRLRITRSPQSGVALMQAALLRCDLAATQKAVDIAFAPQENAPLLADRSLVVELLSVLIAQALRHTHAPARIEVATSRTEAGLRFSVRDGGPPLPPALLRDAFTGSCNASVRRRLSFAPLLARAVVGAHGGTLALESDTSSLTVSFVLPFAPSS